MRLQIFIISCIINALFSFGMAALVLLSRPLTKVKITWAAMCASVGVWMVGIAVMSATTDFRISYLGSFVLTGSSIFIPTFLVHTVHNLLNRTSRKALYFVYGYSFFLSIINLRGDLMSVKPALDFPFYTTAKPAYALFVINLYGVFALVEYILWKEAKKAQPLIKKQLMGLFLGAGFGFLGGQMTVPLVYGVPLFPYGVFFVPVYIFFVGRAMLKYQFMDFKFALRKLGLTLGIYACFLVVLLPAAWPFLTSTRHLPADSLSLVLILTGFLTLLLAAGPVIYAVILQKSFWLKSHSTVGLTHELKSPLTNIRGAVDYLDCELAKINGNQNGVKDYLAMLERNTARLEVFVADLLNIAAIQEGEIQLNSRVFSLVEATTATLESFRPLAKSKGLTLKFMPNDVGQVFADPAKIQQVLSNLISNAIKFTKDAEITVTFHKKGTMIEGSVADQGIGIDKEDLPKIFNRFYQGRKNSTTKGAGIGLTIAKAWVEAHGGKIWVESGTQGKGTKIVFTLAVN